MSPERGGTLQLLVDGRGRGAARGRAARGPGLQRRRLAGARRVKIEPAASLEGHFAVPGDKSISHRALLLGAISRRRDARPRLGPLRRHRVDARRGARARARRSTRSGDDARSSTASACAASRAREPIDCSNAGTLARLSSGCSRSSTGRSAHRRRVALARPMERVAEPLRRMGAQIETTDGHLPLTIDGRARSQAIDYELPVASAQVKSAVLLAGLGASGRDDGDRAAPTRDHTELMLAGRRRARRHAGRASVSVDPPSGLSLGSVDVPGDFSSAAPFIVAATLLPGSRITIHDVGLNPRRTGLLDVLERMGARIGDLQRAARSAGEQVGDIEVRSAELDRDDDHEPSEVPLLVDELPLFALLAAHAHGDELGLRRRRAAAQGDRPDRGGRRRAARDRRARSRRTTTASRSPACPTRPKGGKWTPRRPPDRDARRDRRARLARGRRDRGRGERSAYPSPASSTSSSR